jgi:putative ATP-dependent endonuclease of OLD family
VANPGQLSAAFNTEAMLGRGVIVVEGITEQLVLQAVAEKLEAADDTKYPLDLSGVTIITTDGDGSIPEFGRFFVSLDLPTFAFFDKKVRSQRDQEALEQAGLQILNEISYAGMEYLLAAEVPLHHQWTYLEQVRDSGVAPKIPISTERPTDDKVREFTWQVLKGGKGWGRAADLIERCATAELPPTIVAFLDQIYALFPRPKTQAIAPAGEGDAATPAAPEAPPAEGA